MQPVSLMSTLHIPPCQRVMITTRRDWQRRTESSAMKTYKRLLRSRQHCYAFLANNTRGKQDPGHPIKQPSNHSSLPDRTKCGAA